MAGFGDTYRHYIPDVGLSIEKNTRNVPQDDKYYLLYNGQIVRAFRTLKKAEIAFREMLPEYGYKPKSVEKKPMSATEQEIERYLDAKDIFWAEGPKYRGKGGKGGRGGV